MSLNSNECSIRFYSPDFTWLFETRRAESVQMTRELYGPGRFEIHIHPQKLDDLAVLKRDNLIVINSDGHKAGIIRDFIISEARDRQEITIFGDTGAGLCKQRLTVPPTEAQKPGARGWDSITGNAETVIRHFAGMNLATPYDAKRKMPNLVIAPDLRRGKSVSWRARYTNLADEMYNIGTYTEMGYEIYAEPAGKRWVLDVVPGADRTAEQDTVSPVTFRMEYQNVDGYKYTEDYQNYRNTGYAGGAGSDEKRFFQIIGAENEGIARHEAFLDCGNIEAGDVSELKFYGSQKLGEFKEAKTVEAGALPRVFAFEKDYFLGDEVTVHISRLGIRLNTRITVVKDIWERPAGHRTEVRFGGRLPNLFTILNQKSNKEVV